MKFPFFRGERTKPEPEGWKSLPEPRYDAETLPEYYNADSELTDAVNVALLMGRPLLLTGEPGTGKTQLANRLAWELDFGKPLKFETKSDSIARDLFYTYNVLSRFYDAQCNRGENALCLNPEEAVQYISYNALGKAVILTLPKEETKAYLPRHFEDEVIRPRRSVVLIDEIDKAPRDFPNDILNEIEQMYFRIPEMNNIKVAAAPKMNPVVVITSNSEKHLPDPFLRRCIYHHIRFPKPERMLRIIEGRLCSISAAADKAEPEQAFLKDALDLFYDLRNIDPPLSKKPSTAELIIWIQAMQEMSDSVNPVADDRECAVRALGALVKTGDLERAGKFVAEWRK